MYKILKPCFLQVVAGRQAVVNRTVDPAVGMGDGQVSFLCLSYAPKNSFFVQFSAFPGNDLKKPGFRIGIV